MMSRMSSMPIDRRTNSGVTPVCACSSGVSCECVVVAGWMISDFASPMFARWLNSLTLLISLTPASLPPLMPKPTIAALPVGQVLLRVGVVGMAGQARIIHPRDGRMLREKLGHGQGVLRVPLHPQVQRLQAQQRQERPERALARRPCRAASACGCG